MSDAYQAAAAHARDLLERARRYAGLSDASADPQTAQDFRRLAKNLEAEAAIEMAHAALLRNQAEAETEQSVR